MIMGMNKVAEPSRRAPEVKAEIAGGARTTAERRASAVRRIIGQGGVIVIVAKAMHPIRPLQADHRPF